MCQLSKLAVPSGLAWDADIPGKAAWGAVENASGYKVQLYKDGTAETNKVGSEIDVPSGVSATPAAVMAENGTGACYFKVKAVGGTNYGDGDWSDASDGYAYTAKVNSLTVSPTVLDFGTSVTGYTQPDAQRVTIENIGDAPVTVPLPSHADYTIAGVSLAAPDFAAFSGDSVTLAGGEKAQFTVAPKADLAVGAHNASLSIAATDTNIGSQPLNLNFLVIVGTVATPVADPAEGTYTAPQSVELTCATEGATIRYTLDGKEPTESSTPYVTGTPIVISATTTLKAKAFKTDWADGATLTAAYTVNIPNPPAPPAPDEPAKPYFMDADGKKHEFDTVREALNAAPNGANVIVPARAEVTGDLVIPFGVSLTATNMVYTNPANDGRLIVYKNSALYTTAGELIRIGAPLDKAVQRKDIAAYFTGLEISGTLVNGGSLTLNSVEDSGDGVLEVAATGEVVLNGASMLGKVKLAKGRTITLGETFTADQTAATVFLGDDYELGRQVLSLNGDTGKYAKYFALGDAPDKSWYIGEDGKLTSKPSTDYLLLDKLIMGKARKISAKNLLPLKFTGGVTWTSDNPAVLKITGKGVKKNLKAVNLGTANLTAVFVTGESQTIPVTVIPKKDAANKLTGRNNLMLRAGATKTIKVKVKPATALDKTVKWFTSDATVATVNRGLITAVSKGKCKVYALTAGGGRKVIGVQVKGAKLPKMIAEAE